MKRADREPVEIYSRATNAWIIRTPGRKYPAMVLQRDSFNHLLALAESIATRARECADAELTEEADELRELLSNRPAHYVGVLREYGFHLPFWPRPFHIASGHHRSDRRHDWQLQPPGAMSKETIAFTARRPPWASEHPSPAQTDAHK